jgi:hypothetical protein
MTVNWRILDSFLKDKSQSFGHCTNRVVADDGQVHRFTTICSGGVKPEGFGTPLYASLELAVSDYVESLKSFIAPDIDRPDAVIYWRQQPTVEGDGEMFFVYSRLLVGPPGLKDPV